MPRRKLHTYKTTWSRRWSQDFARQQARILLRKISSHVKSGACAKNERASFYSLHHQCNALQLRLHALVGAPRALKPDHGSARLVCVHAVSAPGKEGRQHFGRLPEVDSRLHELVAQTRQLSHREFLNPAALRHRLLSSLRPDLMAACFS